MAGKAWKFGDNISTDLIAPGRFFHLRSNLPELAKHTLEDANEEFPKGVQEGDFVVAGNNFGLGSSREHAPTIIKLSGVRVVLAKSFARIFFRNAINVGLAVLECDTDKIDDGDKLEIDMKNNMVRDVTKNSMIEIKTRMPKIMREILTSGGLVPYIQKHGDFEI